MKRPKSRVTQVCLGAPVAPFAAACNEKLEDHGYARALGSRVLDHPWHICLRRGAPQKSGPSASSCRQAGNRAATARPTSSSPSWRSSEGL